MKQLITVNQTDVNISFVNNEIYISLTDMVKAMNSERDLIGDWMRLNSTIEFLGTWEVAFGNTNFNLREFEDFKNRSGSNTFNLSPKKWIENTNAIGIISRAGRYGGGTWAHEEIALEFASWMSPTFKVYVIREYAFFKKTANQPLNDDWHLKRRLASINYMLHTDAIKSYLTKHPDWKENLVYASEADLLNVAVFGMTSKEWREMNPTSKGNIRDYAESYQLIVLSNLEVLNAEYIQNGVDKEERLFRLHNAAQNQLMLFEKKNLLR